MERRRTALYDYTKERPYGCFSRREISVRPNICKKKKALDRSRLRINLPNNLPMDNQIDADEFVTFYRSAKNNKDKPIMARFFDEKLLSNKAEVETSKEYPKKQERGPISPCKESRDFSCSTTYAEMTPSVSRVSLGNSPRSYKRSVERSIGNVRKLGNLLQFEDSSSNFSFSSLFDSSLSDLKSALGALSSTFGDTSESQSTNFGGARRRRTTIECDTVASTPTTKPLKKTKKNKKKKTVSKDSQNGKNEPTAQSTKKTKKKTSGKKKESKSSRNTKTSPRKESTQNLASLPRPLEGRPPQTPTKLRETDTLRARLMMSPSLCSPHSQFNRMKPPSSPLLCSPHSSLNRLKAPWLL